MSTASRKNVAIRRANTLVCAFKRMLTLFLACSMCVQCNFPIAQAAESSTVALGSAETSKSTSSAVAAHSAPEEVLEIREQKPSGKDAADSANTTSGIPLSESRLRELALLLPPFANASDVPKKSEIPSYTRKPPPTNDVIQLEFPPRNLERALALTGGESDVQPLNITQVIPKGSVPSTDACTIVFDQPMVPVTTNAVSDESVPVKLTPKPPGNWRWLDTNTLTYQLARSDNFPRSTTYEIAINAGVKSQFGSRLENTYKSSFSTPVTELKSLSTETSDTDPSLAGPLRPVIVLYFDQPVDEDSVLKHLRASNGKSQYSFKLVHAEDFARDEALKKQLDTFAKTKNHVLLQPQTEFSKNSKITFTAEPGIRSLEGPDTSKKEFQRSISTYEPLTIDNHTIETMPGGSGYINFSNNLAAKFFQPSMVTVSPQIKDFAAKLIARDGVEAIQAPGLVISGKTLPGKKYRINFSPQITDIYGQHLAGRRTVVNTVLTKKQLYEEKTTDGLKLSTPRLVVPQNIFRAMVPSENPTLKIWSLNYRTIRVSLYEAKPKDWKNFQSARATFRQMRNSRDESFSSFQLCSATEILTNAEVECWKDTSIELASLINSGRTHIIAAVEGVDPIQPKLLQTAHQARYTQWIEYSPVGLSVVSDHKNLFVMASNAQSGKPMGGAKITMLPSGIEHQTDANGLAKFQIFENQFAVELRDGLIDTFLPHSVELGDWNSSKDNGRYLWYHKTDRNLYRPGDNVFVKGMVRWLDWESGNDRKKLPRGSKVDYSVAILGRRDAIKGVSEIDGDGAFTLNFKLPRDAELGDSWIQFSIHDSTKISNSNTSSERFRIQEFRRPEFEVTLQPDKPSMVLGDTVSLTAKTQYRSGAAFPNGKVHWTVRSNPTYFNFENHDANLNGFLFTSNFFRSYNNRLVAARIGEFRGYSHPVKVHFGKNDAFGKLDGTTDAHGQDVLLVSCKALAEPEPVNLTIETTVQDLNRQSWSKQSQVLVHPADIYVGMKIPKQEFDLADEKSIKLIVADLKSKLMADIPIDVDITYIPNNQNKTDEESNTKPNELVLRKRLISDGATPVGLAFDAKQSGTYLVTAIVHDKQGRLNKTMTPFYVLSEEETEERKLQEKRSHRSDPPERLKFAIKLDKKSYRVGDTAMLQVNGPVAGGHGFLYLQNNRILDVIPFSLVDKEIKIPVSIKESFFPRCNVFVRYFAPNLLESQDIDYLTASIEVPMKELDLKVDVKPEESDYKPGGTADLRVSVRDGNGPVADAQIAIAVVDESIFALNHYIWDDPRGAFSNWYSAGPESTDSGSYRRIELEPEPTSYQLKHVDAPPMAWISEPGEPGELAKLSAVDKYTFFPDVSKNINLFQVDPPVIDERHYTSGRSERHQQTSSGNSANPVQLRSDLNALAYFNDSIHTAVDGTAKISFKLPGNLTRYRVMAVASAGSKEFGSGVSTFKTNMPLMASPSFPRFLNYTDKCDLCLLVHNNTNKPVESEIVVRASNLVLDNHKLNGSQPPVDLAGRKVYLPPQGRVEVRIPAKAEQGNQAIVQAAAVTTGARDAAEVVIPLQPPVTAEAFASTGHVDNKPVSERIEVPPGLVPEVGGLNITTSSTAMQNLVDAGIYLRRYSFDCSEQLSSQILGLAALDSLLSKFPGSSELNSADVRKFLTHDVEELVTRQKSNGSFGLWNKSEAHESPFVAIQCTKALWIASKRGLPVDDKILEQAKRYLKEIKHHIPKAYRSAPDVALRAQALNLRLQMGDADAKEAHRVLAAALAQENRDESDSLKLTDIQEKLYHKMSLESMAWLWPVLASDEKTKADADAVRVVLLSHLSETTADAEFQNNIYGSDSYELYYSSSRLTAVVLDSMIDSEPQNAVIPKLVKELLEKRRNGRWRNTQENAHALIALSKYFDTFEKQVPNFVSQLWLGNQKDAMYSEEKFVGRSMTSKQLKIPMEYLVAQPKGETLTLAKNGDGRLYYRLELKYAQKNLKLAPTSRGFEVSRSFELVDKASDSEPVDKSSDGSDSNVARDSSGTMHVKAGTMVRVKLKIIAQGTRHHVAVVDALPAGFEPIDSSFSGNRIDLFLDSPHQHWNGYWTEHVNLRDNRVELFASELNRGEYEYSYYVRATQLGSFIVPPCKAEEMYNPETFGRSGTEFVSVD